MVNNLSPFSYPRTIPLRLALCQINLYVGRNKPRGFPYPVSNTYIGYLLLKYSTRRHAIHFPSRYISVSVSLASTSALCISYKEFAQSTKKKKNKRRNCNIFVYLYAYPAVHSVSSTKSLHNQQRKKSIYIQTVIYLCVYMQAWAAVCYVSCTNS